MPFPEWLSQDPFLTLLQVALVAAIGVYTQRKEMLNAAGALTAVLMGAAIVVATNIFWLALLFSFLAMSSVATRLNFRRKEERKVAEKNQGRRRTRNVLANGLTPAIAAVLAPFLVQSLGPLPAAMAFVCAVAVAGADTLASEFGSLADRVYLITTLKPVPPGTDGGFSVRGQVAAAGGATVIALLGLGVTSGLTPGVLHVPFSWHAIWIPVACGFFGCQVDSVLGATFEGKGFLNKEEVNFLSITAGAVLGASLAVLMS